MHIINLTISFFIMTGQMVSASRSPIRLAALAEMEWVIYNFLDNHSRVLEQRSSLVMDYLKDFEDSSARVMKEFGHEDYSLRISNNPILSYRMVRRYAKLLQPIYVEMTHLLKQSLLQEISKGKSEEEVLSHSQWPFDRDLNDAMEGLLRIQHVYNVDLKKFTAGELIGTHTNIELTAKQCHEIGEYAIQLKQFTSGILWFEVALKKSKTSADVSFTDNIITSIQVATEVHDIAWNNKSDRDHFFFLHKLNETANGARISLRDVKFERQKLHNQRDSELRFWGLCSGENYQTDEEIGQLFCWYETGRNAYWIINPLKIEQLSSSPYLIQIYDILSQTLIQAIKLEAIPRLRRAPRMTEELLQDSFHAHLIGSELAQSISRKIELITGLVTARGIKGNSYVKAYATGGQDGCHLDYMSASEKGESDYRVASMRDDPEIGGYTVFPTIGVAAKPLKRSVIFFFNMLRNGGPDMRTDHCGCPIVLGQKWVTVKLFRLKDQFHTRPCGLNKDE